MVSLTTLAPDIVAAILDDVLPNHITLFDLAVDPPVLWVALREAAEEHLVELRVALEQMTAQSDTLVSESRESLLEKARQGEIIVIDVRRLSEFNAGHLTFARSLPLDELEKRLVDLPVDRAIVAYCRWPLCLMSDEAVSLLAAKGYRARKILDGVSEWQAVGLPVEQKGSRI